VEEGSDLGARPGSTGIHRGAGTSDRGRLQFLPPPDFHGETFADFMVLGHIMTAMPAINAILAVVAAQLGIVGHADLPLPHAGSPASERLLTVSPRGRGGRTPGVLGRDP
jgi:hypothetical protein